MNKSFIPRILMTEAGDGSGASGKEGNQNRSAENAIIEKLKGVLTEQFRSMEGSPEFKKTLEGVFTSMLGKSNIDQLRSYEQNQTKLTDDLAAIATQMESFKQRAANIPQPSVKSTERVLKQLLEERMGEIEEVLKARSAEKEFQMRAAAIMTTDNVIDVPNPLPEDILESLSIGAFVDKRRPYEYIFELANRITVPNLDKYKTWLSEGDEEGAFAVIEEGALKPLVSVNLVRNLSEAKKIAGKIVVTDEVPKFRRDAWAIIQRLVRGKMLRDYQNALTAEVIAAAALYVSSALDGQYANPTDFHAIAAVAAQIEALEFMPDILFLNPQDKWRIGMSQDQQGAFYMAVPAVNPTDGPRLMGFRVVTSTKIPVGKFILGEAGLWQVEDEAITVKIGYGVTQIKNGDGVVTDVQHDLDHNRFRMILELFFHSYIDSSHVGSFVYGDFDAIKALLQTDPVGGQ